MADKVNLFVDQGTDFEIKFLITHSNNALANIAPYTVYGALKKYFTSNTQIDMVMTKEVSNSIIVAQIPANTSSNLVGRYLYDIKMVNTSTNNIVRIVEGIMTIMPEVTNV